MNGNYNILRFFLVLVVSLIFFGCRNNKEQENPLDLADYKPSINEAVGTYYFVPIKDEFRDDYKYLNLNKGDTLFLEIKKDLTYNFNKFYFNQGESVNNLSGNLVLDRNNIIVDPSKKIKNAIIYLSGFKKSQKNDLYYYYGINTPTDKTYFEYYIIYKKLK